MTKQQSLKKGDEVSWNSAQGKVHGVVEKKVTSTEKVKGHVAKATSKNVEYKVKSSKSGKEAIHKPSQLKKE